MPSGIPHSDAVLDRVVGMYRAGSGLQSITAATGIEYGPLLKVLARLREGGRIRPRTSMQRLPMASSRADGAACPVCRGPTTPQPVPWGACVTKGGRVCA